MALKLYSVDVAKLALAVSLQSWFNYYFMIRTYSNSMETTLCCIAFYYWPWKKNLHANTLWALVWAACACIIRPTNALIWIFLAFQFLFNYPMHRFKFILYVLSIGSIALFSSLLLDSLFYKEWTFTAWNFVKMNIGSDIASFYGTHPWHWYLSQGIPVIMLSFTPFALYGAWDSPFRGLICWFVGVQSLIAHKEFRFLGPLLPLLHISTAKSLLQLPSRRKWMIYALLAVSHTGVALYLSTIHQRGVIQVMHYLRHQSMAGNVSRILFLTPCHATPFYSHIHVKIPMDMIRCDPPWRSQIVDDEWSLFQQDPKAFMKTKNLENTSHVVAFSSLEFLKRTELEKEFKECAQFFNSHFIDSEKKEGNVIVYCKKEIKHSVESILNQAN